MIEDDKILSTLNESFMEFVNLKANFVQEQQKKFQFLIGKYIVLNAFTSFTKFIYGGICTDVEFLINMKSTAAAVNNSELFGFELQIRLNNHGEEHLIKFTWSDFSKGFHYFDDEDSAKLFIEVNK